ncbi:CHASE2 domain-containing protein [Elstera sp.]|jgi:adenylate cyclase|uniref:CHASE2 domain-containing protein n=1 Tax=Elstera sp. TaxID=1916664 RepID=UPI0037C04195
MVAANQDQPANVIKKEAPEAEANDNRPSFGLRFRRSLKKIFGQGRWMALVALIGLLVLRYNDPQPVQILRLKAFDAYQTLKPREASDTLVTVIDLDEDSLAEIGQWPWSRAVVASMVEKLTAAGAIAIGFDIVFAEPDRLSPPRLADALPPEHAQIAAQLRVLPDTDAQLATVLAKTPTILGQTVADDARGLSIKPIAGIAKKGTDPAGFLYRYAGLVHNLPLLEAKAAGSGLFNYATDGDNVVRRVPAMVSIGGQVYPTLSMEMIRVAAGLPNYVVDTMPGMGVQSILVQGDNPILVPTDSQATLWPHFAKKTQARYLSAREVVKGSFDPARIENKLIIFGASAAGLRDLRTTPVDEDIPGVEVHAQLLESMLTDTLLTRPATSVVDEMLLMLVCGLLIIVGMPLVGARWTVLLVMGTTAGVVGYAWYEFSEHRLLIDATAPVFTTLAVFMVGTYASYAAEAAQRRQIRNTFAFYLSPAMVDRLASDPNQLKLGGETREMTLLFTDVRGFTTISEMFDAQGLTAFMNRYLTPMTDIALAHGAYIDKYIGDAIMAFWNAPLDDAEHVRHACQTVLDMRTSLISLNEELKAEADASGKRFIPINIGMGLNTGPCVVGNMGSTQKFNYSTLGDTVNLAARLEGQSKPYHLDNIIGESTAAAAPDFAMLEVDLIQVKGKTVPVRIFTLIGDLALKSSSNFQKLTEAHEQLLSAYRGQRWDEAMRLIEECRALSDGLPSQPLYNTYIERIEEFRINPLPANWDGVYVATTK